MRSARLIPLVLVAVLAAGTTPAHAWANGAFGANTYGTHDWVLRQAIRLAGARADWVCVRTSLLATDDPDTVDGIDHASGTWWHVYDRWGSAWGGAPEAVRVWFGRAQRRLAAGDRCGASRALGIMSHFVADVAQPMHTDGSLALEDSVHGDYESAVDRRCTASACRYHARSDGRDPAKPYWRTVHLAGLAHPYYAELVKGYAAHGYGARVDAITRRELNRAVNAVADLITSLRR